MNKSPADKRGERSMKRGARLVSCGVPADSACAVPAIFMTGDRYMRVEHHRGVLLLTPSLIRLCSSLGVIRIEGSGLAAASMDGDVLLLDGRVRSVSFE